MESEKYSKLKFPIHKKDFRTVDQLFKVFPGLKRYLERADRDRTNIILIIKYIIFLYDEGTDLIEEYPDDLQLRKDMAAIDAGWQKKKDKWPKELLDIMAFKDKIVNDWILDYMKVQKNQIFREWMISEQELDHNYSLRAQLMADAGLDSDPVLRGKLMTQCDDLIKKIRMYKTQFYEGNPDLKSATENDAIPIKPENVFKVLGIDLQEFTYKQVKDVSTIQRRD